MTRDELITKKIGAINLGCDKNRVSLEKMLGDLKEYGFTVESDINDCEIIIVNTCSFITPAVKESIDNILLALNQKQNKCEKVIVSGCLPDRYNDEVASEMPEVDLFITAKDNKFITKKIEELYSVEEKYSPKASNRLLTTPNHYAYLKIADGCNNGCAYCTIPRIRGRYVSVPMDELVKEAKYLGSIGVKEIILVAQDITKYGEDLYEKNSLIELINNLSKIKSIEWIRLHYCYPESVNDELLEVIANNPKVCKYIDIPLQHVDNEILYEMNRRVNESQTYELIEKIKNNYPNIAIRSTFIVGFPGETRKQFAKLVSFIKKYKLNNVGFFPYYREEKTKAYFMKNQVSKWSKMNRLHKVQKAQEQIANQLNSQRIGQVVKVLLDDFDEVTGNYLGRDEFNSPSVDFVISVTDNGQVKTGDFVNVKITNYDNGIFRGEIVWIYQTN